MALANLPGLETLKHAHNEQAMLSGQNLHFSRLVRVALLCSLPALAAQAFGQLAPMGEPNTKDLFPNVGGRPEFLTVFDMRGDTDPAERMLAKSVQGLYNSQLEAHDKIYLILDDEDASSLDWLVQQQFVLSAGYLKTMDELLLRWPSRDSVSADGPSMNAATAVAGCEKWLVATDPNLIKKYHLHIRQHLAGRWSSEAEADKWLLNKYGEQLNHRILVMPSGGDDVSLADYGIANKVFAFQLGEDSDKVKEALRTDFDSNIPCLSAQSAESAAQDPSIRALSENAKFVVPLSGLSNLSVWTTFRPFNPEQPDIYWGATRNPRRYVIDDLGEKHFDVQQYDKMTFKAHDLSILREIAPPLFESAANVITVQPEDRDAFRIGLIDEDSYGAAFGEDRDRIMNGYLKLSRDIFDLCLP